MKQNMKNIRRRLYDSLNVMLAAGILAKSKNLIAINYQK
jgi:hypothetical protein